MDQALGLWFFHFDNRGILASPLDLNNSSLRVVSAPLIIFDDSGAVVKIALGTNPNHPFLILIVGSIPGVSL